MASSMLAPLSQRREAGVGEIKYEIWPPHQKGGQHVGPGPQGVRGVHFIDGHPSGIEACCGIHRSQHKNRRAVEEMIEWALTNA